MAAIRAPDLILELFRRVDFRGKGRLQRHLRVPSSGTTVASFPGGFRLELDLREALQRDFAFGLYERAELAFVRRVLANGGDTVDVGAHVGMVTLAMAAALRGRGRVLAIEPNPHAREQLERNVALNGARFVHVVAAGAGPKPGRGSLHIPRGYDPAFSSFEGRAYDSGETVDVELTTVDAECERLGLVPVLVKIDVEGGELGVLEGMARTLELLPFVICEVGTETAADVERLFVERGYGAFRVEGGRKVFAGVAATQGWCNAVFVPPDTTIRP